MNRKVSILTPCYNMEKYIVTFLESVLNQDYTPMELILVDDGSTDRTAEHIFSYKSKLEEQGITVKYIKKENGGQASAMAEGLPYVEGDYLTWPDSDDFLLKDSIRHRAAYLDTHPDCGLVRCNGYVYNEEDVSSSVGVISKFTNETTLEDFVKFQVSWCPGCYMARMSAFDETNPGRVICNSLAGQEIQMVFPIVHQYPCAYMDEYLYGYVVRQDSHSHSINSYEQRIQRAKEYEACVEETLKVIKEDTGTYLEMNKKFIRKLRYQLAWQFSKPEEMKKFGQVIKEKGEMDFELILMKWFPYCRFSKFLVKGWIYILRRTGHYG